MTSNQYLENINRLFKTGNARELSFEDILQYQNIILALSETYRIMREIDGEGE